VKDSPVKAPGDARSQLGITGAVWNDVGDCRSQPGMTGVCLEGALRVP
jgi:hypothetical protein